MADHNKSRKLFIALTLLTAAAVVAACAWHFAAKGDKTPTSAPASLENRHDATAQKPPTPTTSGAEKSQPSTKTVNKTPTTSAPAAIKTELQATKTSQPTVVNTITSAPAKQTSTATNAGVTTRHRLFPRPKK